MKNEQMIYIKEEKNETDEQDISKLFSIRVRCWYRNYFKLSHVASILGQDFVNKWVEYSINNILIQTENGMQRWKNIEALILEKCPTNPEYYDVWVQINQKRYKVSNPVRNKEFDQMRVTQLREVTVDHVIPISFVVNALKKKNSALKKLIENKNENSDFYKGQHLTKEEVDELAEALNTLCKENDCILMTQSQNSKKRNNVNYIGYIRNGECDYDFIMAKELKYEGRKFYVCYTFNDDEPKLFQGDAPFGIYNNDKAC